MSKCVKHETDPNTPKREEFKKEFNCNNSDYKKLTSAAGARWKLLSDSDKAPYVLKAQKLKGNPMIVENDNEDEFEEYDKSMADKSEFDKLESGKLKSVKSECGAVDDHEQGSNSLKVNGDDKKTEIDEGEDELKTIITDFARFEEALTPIKPITPAKGTNLHNHLNELEKLFSLPLETLLESANLFQLQNTLKLVRDLAVADRPNTKLSGWCNRLLEVTMVTPKQRIGIQKALMETEAKAQTMHRLQKEASDIRKTTLLELQRKEECSTCITRVDAKIESLKRQLVEAEAERATLTQLEGELAVSKHQKLKKARIVHHVLAPLAEQNAAINKFILDSKNAIKQIDHHLNALIVLFNVLKDAA